MYVKLPASAGVKVAPASITSLTFKSRVELVTLISVGVLGSAFVKLIVIDTVSKVAVTLASPISLAVYTTFSPIEDVV